MDKFLGMGLKKAMGFLIFIILGIVFLKVIVTKYPIPGVTELVQSV